MPEAEISPAGEVLVEGHHVGELQGFRFTADRAAEGEDARAVKAAAQKALAAEFEARAERFGAAPNGDLAIGSDNTLRWLGAPIARLTAGDAPLKPRVILLADDQLAGPSRDKVAARAERFVNFQVEQLLKPLVDLGQAEQLTGMARGLAFRLVENFGLLNRRDVADEVRALDQDARGALRRLGVRFGAYHVFVPALLKPAPAGLATQLWALANDAQEKPGYGDVVAALAAGRTSIVTDPSFERAFYRLAGFRNLGRRAVRVDILERLADLIRPALAWRPGNGPRPEGAFDGATFMATPAMMSILGATAEDMEAILKGLGYRAEAKPAGTVSERLRELDGADAQASDTEQGASGEEGAAEQEKAEPAAEPSPTQVKAEDVPSAVQTAPSSDSTDGVTETAVADGPVAPAEPAQAADEPETPEAPAEEPKPVLLWRPARFEGRGRQGGRHQDGAQKGHKARSGEAKGKGKHGPRRDGDGARGKERKPGDGRPGHGPGKPDRPARIDPDSPFAKLAALRDQMRK